MSLTETAFRAVHRLFPARPAHAHCDVPCGIYDPVAAKIAAQTVLKMVMRIEALERPSDGDAAAHADYNNKLIRYTATKEQHAELCKRELVILWGDYFRPDHLEKCPDLHTQVWTAVKLGGRNKQNVDRGAAQELVEAVDRIAQIFWETKNVAYDDAVGQVRFGA
jgi:nickel superoxide dismutase